MLNIANCTAQDVGIDIGVGIRPPEGGGRSAFASVSLILVKFKVGPWFIVCFVHSSIPPVRLSVTALSSRL